MYGYRRSVLEIGVINEREEGGVEKETGREWEWFMKYAVFLLHNMLFSFGTWKSISNAVNGGLES